MRQRPLIRASGFTIIELLLVILIIGILTSLILGSVGVSRRKAHDNAIRNAVRQLRWQAEIVFDSQGGSYKDWSLYPEIQPQVNQLKAEIDEHVGQTNQYTICDGQRKEFCISAPLRSDPGSHACVDATGAFITAATACTCTTDATPPLRCPAS